MNIDKHMCKLRQRFADFVGGVRLCRICNTKISDTAANYCAICGSNALQSGRLPMIYKAIRTTENGKALVCPHCDNEELTQGDFCIICGSDIVNRCADMRDSAGEHVTVKGCRTILPGNARYCSKCGNESMFFRKGWLRDWRRENTKKAIDNINVTVDFNEIKEERSLG